MVSVSRPFPNGESKSAVHTPGNRRKTKYPAGELLDGLRVFLKDYIVLPDEEITTVSAWVMAGYLADLWDRFPHLAITSAGKRCGKTRLLELLNQVCCKPWFVSRITAASLRRLVEKERPTILFDEAQSLSDTSDEFSLTMHALFCGSIVKDIKETCCTGEDNEPTGFSIYCPKAVALIGDLDNVLADRCLPVRMERKSRKRGDDVKRYRSAEVKLKAEPLSRELLRWSQDEATRKKATDVYSTVDLLDISSDRMAELLTPIQTVIHLSERPDALSLLTNYAARLDLLETQEERLSVGERLLSSCKDIFTTTRASFLNTSLLVCELRKREEEPWAGLNAERLAYLLRQYNIRPARNARQTARGYHRQHFKDAWERYVP